MENVTVENDIIADLVNPYSNHAYDGQRLNSILKRRQSILSETRKVISEVGLDEFKISHIALRCGTTTQTIYNNFGPKIELISRSLTDYVDIIHDISQSISNEADFFLNYHKAYYLSCLSYPDFMRELIFCSMNKKNAMIFRLSEHGKLFKFRILEDLERHGLLKKFIDKRRFINHFSRSTAFNIFTWACSGQYGDLRDRLMSETAVLLSDILTDRAQQDVQRWLEVNLPELERLA